MRARSVNENISFERGKDPKDAMDIGYYAKYSNKFGDGVSKTMVKLKSYLDKYGFYLEEEDLIPPVQLIFNNDKGDTIEIHQKETLGSGIHGVSVDFSLADSGFFFEDGLTRFVDEEVDDIIKKDIFKTHFEKTLAEGLGFERESNPQKSLRLGKYKPMKLKFKDYDGDTKTIEVIDNSFNLNDLEVKVEFKNIPEFEDEMADVYVDGQKSDINAFKMTPFDYEFKEQGEYADPGFTGYGFPIARDKDHLEKLKEKHSYWHVSSGDFERTDKNPFIAIAKMILFTY
jgi:hypothetical protein